MTIRLDDNWYEARIKWLKEAIDYVYKSIQADKDNGWETEGDARMVGTYEGELKLLLSLKNCEVK